MARVVEIVDEMVSSSPVGAILKSSVAAAASLGALNSLAGATTLVTSSNSATLNATVGVSTAPGVAFAINGTTSPAGSWQITGSSKVAPGMNFSGLTGPGEVDTGNLPGNAPILSGTPTTAGTYILNLIAWENPGQSGIQSPTYTFTVVVSASANAPSFTVLPQDTTAIVGTAVSLTASASGSPTYQWQKNGTNVSGANSATLTLGGPQTTDSGTYTVIATNGSGATTSSGAVLTVVAANSAPIFTAQPVPQNVAQGVTVNFNATAVGPGTISYQWKLNGSNLSGQTSSTLTLSNVQLGNGGTYSVAASNSNGSTASSNAALSVTASDTPVFTTQPQAQTATVGATVVFTAVATGGAYQWYRNGAPISGATNATLTLTNVQTSAAGDYTASADNTMTSDDGYGDISTTGGMTLSTGAQLVVNSGAGPSFTTQPQSQAVSSGGTVTLTAGASGSPTYQWEFNGIPIAGATNSTLVLSNVTAASAGNYSVLVTNANGTAQSSNAAISISAVGAPAFNTSPASQSATVGQTVTFTAAASGTPTYQWQLNGAPISGATNASLVLTNVTAASAGTYTVVATNGGGSVTSTGATLTVSAAPTVSAPAFTSQPTSLNVASGTTVVFNTAASGSPTPTFQWKLGSANVAGATSARLVISGATAANAGSYTCVATNSQGSATSSPATLAFTSTTNVGRLINLSVLTTAGKSQTLTVGFVSGGGGTTGSENVLIRATGPALAALGVSGTLADPTLAVFNSSNAAVATNDNWGTPASNQALITSADSATFAFPLSNTASLDAAVATALTAGAYTAQVSGNTAPSGTALAEVYDNTPTASYTLATPRLINISANNQIVASGSMTAGFVVGGTTAKTVLIRATGPALTVLGVQGAIPDPQLALHTTVNGQDTVVASNAGWGGDPQITAASNSVFAFPLTNPASKDSVVLVTLAPGSYTAIASSVSGVAGTVLIEVYEVP